MLMSRPFVMSCLLASALVACGDDGGKGGGGNPDAPNNPNIDAPMADAPMQTTKQIGSACVPSQTDPAGDCGAGFTCLQLQGGNGAWCSKTCTQGSNTCAMGYTGHGVPQCIYQVTPQGGGAAQTFCGIVCQVDDTTQCPATVCDQMCPAPLMCTAPLQNQMGMQVAKACQ